MLAFFATIIQYYDYALFGLSASILAKEYLPNNDIIPNFLSFFAILTFTVVMRPVGSIIFGKIGDKFGRSIVIKISVFIASISTLSVGLISASQNINSALILILSRMLFIMSLAGEGDGVRIYVAETISQKREFFGNALVTCSSQLGVLIASAMYALSCSEIMPEYWWRVSFILGGIAGLILLYFRSSIIESTEFTKISKANGGAEAKFSIADHYKIISTGIIITGFIGGIYTFYIIFYGHYLSSILQIVNADYMAQIHIISIIIYIISTVFSGYIADKYNPYRQVLISLFCAFLLSIINAIFISYGIFNVPSFLLSVASIPFFAGSLQIMFKRQIPIMHRLKIFSLAHSFGSLLFSSSSALVSSYLWHATHLSFAPMLYMIGMIAVIFLVTIQIHITEEQKCLSTG